MGTNIKWTAEDVETLIDDVEEALSASEIARKTGRTRNSIIGMCYRRGLILKGIHPNVRNPNPGGKQNRKRGGKTPVRGLGAFADTPEPLGRNTPTQAPHCQYIYNDDMKNPDFCKQPKTHDSYCQEHFELCCPHQAPRQRVGWK